MKAQHHCRSTHSRVPLDMKAANAGHAARLGNKGLVKDWVGRMKHRNRHLTSVGTAYCRLAETCYGGGHGLSFVSSCNRGNWSVEVQSPPFLAALSTRKPPRQRFLSLVHGARFFQF